MAKEKEIRAKSVLYPNLAAELARRGITGTMLAKHAGISPNTIYPRMNGESDWKLTEMLNISALLGKSMDYLFGGGEEL